MEIITPWLTQIFAIGGCAASIAYLIFRFLGKNWIEEKFAERLANYKHDQQIELENMKFQINALLNRVSKIQQKEMEVLPEAWAKLFDALSLTSRLVSVFRHSPDLDRMSEPQLKHFLQSCTLHDFEKEKLSTLENKTEYYNKVVIWHEIGEVRKSFAEFHVFIQKNSIFMSTELKDKFNEIDDLLWDAIVKREIGEQSGDGIMHTEAWKEIRDKADPIKKEIEALVQKKLRFAKAE